MVRFILIIATAVLITSCGASTKSYSSAKGLMLQDNIDLPRNAKFRSSRYQQKLRKSQKNKVKQNRKRYRRAGR